MKAIALYGIMDTDYVICPITLEVEQKLPELDERVQGYMDEVQTVIEIVELTDPEAIETAWTYATDKEGLDAVEGWVEASGPNA